MDIPSQMDADFQQVDQQMDEQEPPDDTHGSVQNRPDPTFSLQSLQSAAQLILQAQQQEHGNQSLQLSSDSSVASEAIADDTQASEQPSRKSTPPLPRKPSDAPRGQKHKWSQDETQALVDGCNKHGVGNWKKILSDPEFSQHFSERSAGDLKDRFRTYFPDAYHEMYPNAKTHLSKAVRGKDAEGKSIFGKGKAKERRPFTAEEDAALRRGYHEHGSHWALIAKDPAFQDQRRAIDLRDRFRNAFPDDYERAGFKPRATKCKKDRRPSAGKARENAVPAVKPSFPFPIEGGLSEGFHAEFSMSDASDGHLTDHGNLTDSNEGSFLGRTEKNGGALLTRSNSLGAVFRTSRPKLQQNIWNHGHGESKEPPVPQRPPYASANTMPLPRGPLNDEQVSVSTLFRQLQETTLNSTATQSEASSVHGMNTPPSEIEHPLLGQSTAASTEESRCHAGKPKDAASHKRRSHSSRTGKSSALDHGQGHELHLLPSKRTVHGHAHCHGPAAPAHAQLSASNEGASARRPVLSHLASSESASSEASWSAYGPAPSVHDDQSSSVGQPFNSMTGASDVAMDVDEPFPGHGVWHGQQSAPSDISAASLNTPRSSIYSHVDYPNLHLWSTEVAGQMAQRDVSQVDKQNLADQSRLVDTTPYSKQQQVRSQTCPEPNAQPSFGSQPLPRASTSPKIVQDDASVGGASSSRGVWSSAMDTFLDPVQDLLDPLGPTAANLGGSNSGWVNVWNMATSEHFPNNDDSAGVLSSTPLSHHRWAGDLHLPSASVAGNNLNAILQSIPNFDAGLNMPFEARDEQASEDMSQQHRSGSNLDANLGAREKGSMPQRQSDGSHTARMMSIGAPERIAGMGSAPWSPTRRVSSDGGSGHPDGAFSYGQAATNPCPTPSPIDEVLRRASRRLSDPSRSAELFGESQFSLEASLGLDSSAFYPALATPSLGMRRRRSNDTLRNSQDALEQENAQQFGLPEASPDLFRQSTVAGERRNSVPAAAMLGQISADFVTRGISGDGPPSGPGAGLGDPGSAELLGQLDHLNPSYAASLPDASSASAVEGSRDRTGRQWPPSSSFSQQQVQQPQQMYSYDDIDLAALADLDRSPSRLYAEAQELFSQLQQLTAPWPSTGAVSSVDVQLERQNHGGVGSSSVTAAGGGVSYAQTEFGSIGRPVDQGEVAPGWSAMDNVPIGSSAIPQQSSNNVMRSASASHVDHKPQVMRGFLRNDAASSTMTAPTLLNALEHNGGNSSLQTSQALNAASLWASSGSLDRLEHLYLEGLHSSPCLAAASPLGASNNAAATGSTRSGWLLSGASELGTGYLSE